MLDIIRICRMIVVMEVVLTMSNDIRNTELEELYEHGLPEYLQHDLDAYKEGLRTDSSLLDCLWGELYGSINIAQINDGAITPDHADYLRKKYLYGGYKN